jgi:hypothetical protein
MPSESSAFIRVIRGRRVVAVYSNSKTRTPRMTRMSADLSVGIPGAPQTLEVMGVLVVRTGRSNEQGRRLECHRSDPRPSVSSAVAVSLPCRCRRCNERARIPGRAHMSSLAPAAVRSGSSDSCIPVDSTRRRRWSACRRRAGRGIASSRRPCPVRTSGPASARRAAPEEG